MDASRSADRADWVTVRSEASAPLVLKHGIDGGIQYSTSAAGGCGTGA